MLLRGLLLAALLSSWLWWSRVNNCSSFYEGSGTVVEGRIEGSLVLHPELLDLEIVYVWRGTLTNLLLLLGSLRPSSYYRIGEQICVHSCHIDLWYLSYTNVRSAAISLTLMMEMPSNTKIGRLNVVRLTPKILNGYRCLVPLVLATAVSPWLAWMPGHTTICDLNSSNMANTFLCPHWINVCCKYTCLMKVVTCTIWALLLPSIL